MPVPLEGNSMTRFWVCISALLVAAGVFFVGAGSLAVAKDQGVEKTFLDGRSAPGPGKKKTRGTVVVPTDTRDKRGRYLVPGIGFGGGLGYR